jgi:hypothetical protein
LGPRPFAHKQNLLDYLEELKERAQEDEKEAENKDDIKKEEENKSGSDDEGEPETESVKAEKS